MRILASTPLKICISLITLIVALLPFWMYLGAKSFFNPEGFLANLFVAGVAVYSLGALQIVLILLWLIIMSYMWRAARG